MKFIDALPVVAEVEPIEEDDGTDPIEVTHHGWDADGSIIFGFRRRPWWERAKVDPYYLGGCY